jgi:DNA-binding response OmpR family regulator
MARILIAEDERDIRDLISFTLNYNGHEVVVTTNGEEALAVTQNIQPDLVLLDIRMPRMTGYETCQLLKANASTRDIPVIFLSAKGQEAEIDQGYEVGAVEYIVKPFSPDKLIDIIETVLSANGDQRAG